MNVLSLFDGMSCGQLALQRAKIKYNNYYASEIDKYAISVTQYRFPKTVQLGDIKDWYDWQLPHIDMIIGGSPCQGFSSAGKQLNFEDPRSKLFFYFVDILKHYHPQYFLLENVRMKQELQDIISEYIGVQPILIDSALVSAQSRRRLYWTNIPNVTQPQDKGILLQDIIDTSCYKAVKGCAIRGRYDQNGDIEQHVELNCTGKSNALTTVQKDSLVHIEDRNSNPQPTKEFVVKNAEQIIFNGFKSSLSQKRIIKNIRGLNEKSNCLMSSSSGNPAGNGCTNILTSDVTWRKLTPIECERLQTVPDNWTLVPHPVYKNKLMSNTQRYKMLGNGWTVDVIAHIFSFIK